MSCGTGTIVAGVSALPATSVAGGGGAPLLVTAALAAGGTALALRRRSR